MIESYLVAHLGYSWDTVHDEAERLEHAVSDTLVERMAAALGHPTSDPHGDPIPAADGSMIEEALSPLSDAPEGVPLVIRRVSAEDPGLLRHLAERGLRPGVTVTIAERQPFSGPISIAVEDEVQVIGAELARHLLCAEAEGMA